MIHQNCFVCRRSFPEHQLNKIGNRYICTSCKKKEGGVNHGSAESKEAWKATQTASFLGATGSGLIDWKAVPIAIAVFVIFYFLMSYKTYTYPWQNK